MPQSLGSFQAGFFDRPAVQKAVDAAVARTLSKFGAFVRTRARSSLRRRKRPSGPGSPPSVHSGDAFATLKNILFAYDPANKSVIVGPPLLNGKLRGATPVPELHEEGGTAPIREVQLSGGRWATKSYGKRWGMGRPSRTRAARYPARPFMRPAFAAELKGKLADQLRNCVTR